MPKMFKLDLRLRAQRVFFTRDNIKNRKKLTIADCLEQS